jgi:hypothetical protein
MIQGLNFVHINIIVHISPKEEFKRSQSVPRWPQTIRTPHTERKARVKRCVPWWQLVELSEWRNAKVQYYM